jgi:hypothetical protein
MPKVPVAQFVNLLINRMDLSRAEAMDLLSELKFELSLGDVDPPDLFLIGRRGWFAGGTAPAGGAGFRSQLGITNEGGVSNPGLVVIEGGVISSELTASFATRGTASPASFALAGLTNFLRDGQAQPAGPPTAQPQQAFCRGQNTAAAIGTIMVPVLGTQVANTPFPISEWFVLLNSQGIMFDPGADNQGIRGHFWGTEWDLRVR